MNEIETAVRYVKVHIIQGGTDQQIKKLTTMIEDEMWHFELMVYLSALLDQEVEEFKVVDYGEVDITDPLLKEAMETNTRYFRSYFQISLREEPEDGPQNFDFVYVLVKDTELVLSSEEKESD